MPFPAMPPGFIWRPVLPALALAGVLLLLVAMLVVQAKRLSARFGTRRAWPILAARSLTVLLLLVMLLDPVYTRTVTDGLRQRLLILIDRSDSMSVADDGHTSREQRAEAIGQQLSDTFATRTELLKWSFAQEVWKANVTPPVSPRGTDLGEALLAAADQAGDVSAIVLLTDGGDEPVNPVRFPRAPLLICAMGTDPKGWRDTAIESVQGPDIVERGTTFTLTALLRARGHATPAFRDTLVKREVKVWCRNPDGKEVLLATAIADLSGGSAEQTFQVQCAEEGVHLYRVELAAGNDELSPLNNRRTLRIEARRESLDVLYFSRRLGADLKRLRQVLGADPALAFTALYRTGGERYTVQAPEGVDTADLQLGLPAAPQALRRFGCIILGSFPAQLWSAEEMRALLDYVEAGGGLIWLGGDESFEGGGYETSALAPLIPWRMTGGRSTLQREDVSVSIPLSASTDPIVAGLHDLLARAREGGGEGALNLPAFNAVRQPSPAASVLLEVEGPQGRSPLLIAQPYGRGRIYAFASNTSWQWAGGTPGAAAFYRRLWQQMVRAAAGTTDGGRHLQVTWEGNRLRPAGRTSARVLLLDATGVQLRATLTDPQGMQTLPLLPADEPDTWQVNLAFRNRGDTLFRLEALQAGEPIEVYEKTLVVAPPQDEGSHLERQTGFLGQLASREGGRCYLEEESEQLIADLNATLHSAEKTEQVSVVSRHAWFAFALLATLAAEWLLRRKQNLI